MPQTPPPPTPLAQAWRVDELPGRFSKTLPVPAGRQGVAILADESVRRFPPGRSAALSFWERLRGRGAGLLAGYLPAQPFTAALKAPNLLSGDGELLDLSLAAAVEVTDPARFLTGQVVPRRLIAEQTLLLGGSDAPELLGGLARAYAAADLIHGLPGNRLLPELHSRLEPALDQQGLRLHAVRFVSFRRAADRAETAEKALALQQRLKQVELERRMGEIENEAQLREFVAQFDPALGLENSLRSEEPAGPAGHASALDVIKAWILVEAGEDSSGRHWRLEGLFRRARPAESEQKIHERRQLWQWVLRRGFRLLLTTLAGVALTLLLLGFLPGLTADNQIGVLAAIWVPVLGVYWESALAYLRTRETVIGAASWEFAGDMRLDSLTGNNPQRVESLVRQQCALDSENSRAALNDSRERVYRAGNETLALRLRDLEKKCAALQQDVQKPEFGRPIYLGDLRLGRDGWRSALDYDERLLLRFSSLTEAARAAQQQSVQATLTLETLAALEGHLLSCRAAFADRAKALKPQ